MIDAIWYAAKVMVMIVICFGSIQGHTKPKHNKRSRFFVRKGMAMNIKAGRSTVLLGSLLVLFTSSNAFALHFVAYGDTRTDEDRHQQVVDAIAQVNPEMILHTGDLWDGWEYGPEVFKNILRKHANIWSLVQNGKFCVSRGNHETIDALLNSGYDFHPPQSQMHNYVLDVTNTDGQECELYTFTKEGVFFACFGYHVAEHRDWLAQQLSTPEAQNADWRVVYAHWPHYSCGRYSMNEAGGSATTEIFDNGNVDVFFCGHEHHYERTAVMYGNQVVTKSSTIDKSTTRGTVYIVTGGGGVSTREVNPNARTVYAQSIHHFCEVDVTPGQFKMVTKDINGSIIDQVTMRKSASGVLARFSATPLSGPMPFEVSVDAAGSWPSAGLSYAWDFGDGGTASGVTARHTYSTGGTFTISLTVSDGDNEHTATTDITEADPATLPATLTVNDSETGTGLHQFDFSTGWSRATGGDQYQGDEHYCATTDATCTFAFYGSQVVLYGTRDAHHGIGAVSIDGGAEIEVDYYAAQRGVDQVIWTGPVLTEGNHELRIRVTAEKSSSSTGAVVTADRVEVRNSATATDPGDGTTRLVSRALFDAPQRKPADEMVEVYAMDGRLISRVNMVRGTIAAGRYPAGMYLIRTPRGRFRSCMVH